MSRRRSWPRRSGGSPWCGRSPTGPPASGAAPSLERRAAVAPHRPCRVRKERLCRCCCSSCSSGCRWSRSTCWSWWAADRRVAGRRAAARGVGGRGGLVRREGVRAWRALRSARRRTGGVPGREVADGALLLVGGTLLLTPGFVTDAVGLLLVLPPGRAVARRVLGLAAGPPLRRGSGGRRLAAARPRGPRRRAAAAVPRWSRARWSRGRWWSVTCPAGGAAPARRSGPLRTGGDPLRGARRAVVAPGGRRVRRSLGRFWRSTSSRSARTSSSSASLRRSSSMSQCVRGGLTFFGSGRSPSMRCAAEPQTLHSQVGGRSASAANGTAKRCPRGQSNCASRRGASSVLRSLS